MDAMQIWAVAAVFVLAGAVKGVTGMGLPTVAVSLLGLWMAPMQAAALLVLPSLATNLAQCAGPHGRALVARLWPAWLALAVATVAWPLAPSAPGARHALGVVLVLYGLFGLWRPVLADLSRRRPRRGRRSAGAGRRRHRHRHGRHRRVRDAAGALPAGAAAGQGRDGAGAGPVVHGGHAGAGVAAAGGRPPAVGARRPGWRWPRPSPGCGWVRGCGGASAARRFQRALFVVFIALGLANLLRGG